MALQIPTARVFLPLLAPSRYKGAHGGRGSGKCLALGTLVTMATGRLKPVEDIVAGDEVMGPDGLPRRVLSTTKGISELFRITQNGGDPYVVTGEHRLSLKRYKNCDRYPTDGDVCNIEVRDFINKTARWKANYRGYRADAIELLETDQPIPPYVFGAWIGDGCSARQSITSMDEEIVSAFVVWGMSLGCHPVKTTKPGNRASLVILTNVQGQPNPAKEALRALGVLGSKFVPEIYQLGSINQRLEFLAGVIDTDGHYANGCFTISQKSGEIINAVKRIASLCGFRTSLRQKLIKISGEDRTYWSLSISGGVDVIPTRLERKRASTTPNKDWLCGAIKVESVGEGEYAGFELDGDHLFLLADCTVTHNSHFFAEHLVERCLMAPTRALGIREHQRSLKQSSKRLMEDKIQELGVGKQFNVTTDRIDAPGGGVILFEGMQNHTAESIKSFEGFDIAWVEEATALSQRSLDLLRPTIRKPGSELWFSWNPDQPTDPVDKLLRGPDKPPSAVVVEANYTDNPWFPDVLREEMEWDRRRDPDKYAHVWGGGYAARSEARVFKNWRIDTLDIPGHARPYFGADWGFAVDPTVLVRCWVWDRTLYVDREVYRVGCEIDRTPTLFDEAKDELADPRKWAVIADSARPETISYMARNGYPKIEPARKGPSSILDGVEFIKSFDVVIHPDCRHTSDEFSLFSYEIDPHTDEVLPELIDKKNHTIDSIRYAIEKIRRAPVIAYSLPFSASASRGVPG